MAAFKEPKKFNVVPGNAADVTAIQDAASVLNPSMADIFPAIYQVPLGQGGKAPERTTFNQFFKLYGEALYFLQRGGVWSYDATADYPAGAVVGYSGSLYLALKDNGPGTGAVTPGKNTSVWQKLVLESGNAATATKLATARTINGTAFNGTANITTANWGTARNITITDGTNTSTAVSVNGSANVSLNLPATIKANLTGNCSGSSGSCTGNAASATTATTAESCTGNAATATKLAAKRTIALSGAATGTATGFDGSGNITIPVTALSSSAIRAQWYAAYPDGAEAHNAMWGGRDITAAFNNGTVSANIANGTFKDIFPGDYITKQVTIPRVLADDGTTELFAGGTYTVNWVVADCDYWINKGDDPAMTAHHVAIVPQTPIFNARMNATNTTEGGYAGSEMYRNIIPACATGIVNAFGSDHILTFRDGITNSVDTSHVSSGIPQWTGTPDWWGEWVSAQCSLMSEKMVYGAPICSAGAMDNTMATRQMSAFRLSERLINYNRQWWWLRDVVSSARFAFVFGGGVAGARGASLVFGVRPFALLR